MDDDDEDDDLAVRWGCFRSPLFTDEPLSRLRFEDGRSCVSEDTLDEEEDDDG